MILFGILRLHIIVIWININHLQEGYNGEAVYLAVEGTLAWYRVPSKKRWLDFSLFLFQVSTVIINLTGFYFWTGGFCFCCFKRKRTRESFLFQRTWKFSQLASWSSSLPNSHVNICLAFMLALTRPLFRIQELEEPCPLAPSSVDGSTSPSAISFCSSSFNRIWVRIPTSSSSTLWFITTDISMNLAR